MNSKHTGTALILAWPETYCKQAGAWYDEVLCRLKVSKHRYYKVGHAAIVLIEHQSGKCHYFDFGRYHAPFGHGRVRSAESDHELKLNTEAQLNIRYELSNQNEILNELAHKEECHGTGSLHAGSFCINFKMAYAKAKQMEAISPLAYGPFLTKGSNCSRFVRSIMIAGAISKLKKLRLKLTFTISPTPVGNIKCAKNYQIVKPSFEINIFTPTKKGKSFYKCTLGAPEKPKTIPFSSQWLAGEGGGSWYAVENVDDFLRMRKFSPSGKLESDGLFSSDIDFNLSEHYLITYPSNSNILAIEQGNNRFLFSYMTDFFTYSKKQNLQYA